LHRRERVTRNSIGADQAGGRSGTGVNRIDPEDLERRVVEASCVERDRGVAREQRAERCERAAERVTGRNSVVSRARGLSPYTWLEILARSASRGIGHWP
jgi:hypothetical protein